MLLPEAPWNRLKEVGLLCVCSAVHLGTQVGSLSSVFGNCSSVPVLPVLRKWSFSGFVHRQCSQGQGLVFVPH